jgi:sRNA-binding protein
MGKTKANRAAVATADAAGIFEQAGSGSKPDYSLPTGGIKAPTKRRLRFDAGIAVLLAGRLRFPNAIARLHERKRQPLKIGIHSDLIAAMPEFPAAQIELALGIYTTSATYHAACTEGAERIDLDGQPVGVVTADEAAHAAAALEKIRARKRRAAQIVPAPTPPPPAPQRITLSALREAAHRRRAGVK